MSLYATQDVKKQAAAKAALKHLPKGCILGVGTGSTVNFLIDLLPELQLEAAVASSNATAERLKKLGIEVVDMNSVGGLDAYVDGSPPTCTSSDVGSIYSIQSVGSVAICACVADSTRKNLIDNSDNAACE